MKICATYDRVIYIYILNQSHFCIMTFVKGKKGEWCGILRGCGIRFMLHKLYTTASECVRRCLCMYALCLKIHVYEYFKYLWFKKLKKKSISFPFILNKIHWSVFLIIKNFQIQKYNFIFKKISQLQLNLWMNKK